jgi:hypothetical protein
MVEPPNRGGILHGMPHVMPHVHAALFLYIAFSRLTMDSILRRPRLTYDFP